MASKMDSNGDGIISFREYFQFKSDTNISSILIPLSEKLRIIHQSGYCIGKLDSDHIMLEKYDANKISFGFIDMIPLEDKEIQIPDNIENFAKLVIGTIISTPSGFSDYTALPTPYIRSELPNIVTTLDIMGEDSEYFTNIFAQRIFNYYHDYVQKKQNISPESNSMGTGKVYIKTTPAGVALTPSDESPSDYSQEPKAALINILFYPILIISMLALFIIIYNCTLYFM